MMFSVDRRDTPSHDHILVMHDDELEAFRDAMILDRNRLEQMYDRPRGAGDSDGVQRAIARRLAIIREFLAPLAS